MECGGEFANGGIVSEKGDQFFGKTEALAFDSEVGATGDEIERGAKGAEGGFIDRLDGNDGSDTDGKGEEVEEGESFMAKEVTASVGKKDAKSAEPVQELGLDATIDELDLAIGGGGNRLAPGTAMPVVLSTGLSQAVFQNRRHPI